MKKNYVLILLSIALLSVFNMQAANVVPVAGTYYNIVQSPSEMVIGMTNGTQPAVQTKSTSLDQAFEFVPVSGATDTYYIKSASGMYLSKLASSNWSTVFLSATNAESSEWTITDVDTSTVAFRLRNVYQYNNHGIDNCYLATDGTTENSYMYCDKDSLHVRGVFVLEAATVPSDLINAYNSLTLGDVSAVTSNLTLPTSNGNVVITWQSSNSNLVDSTGVVTQPDKYDATAILTATLSETANGQTFTLSKQFAVTVSALNPPPPVLAQWDFKSSDISLVNGELKVADESGDGFVGTVMNDASIRTIGGPTNGTYNVLYTGDGTGYFDMGTDIGQAIYSLKDFTMSCYFRCDTDYTTITNNGNFLWAFTNSEDVTNSTTGNNGYMILVLGTQRYAITSTSYGSEQGANPSKRPQLGTWHHIAYVQNGTTGIIYLDGVAADTSTVSLLPATTLPISGRTGTDYNWLGRSCFPSDSYLKKTMIYDFRILNVALTVDDLNQGYNGFDPVSQTLASLNAAYAEDSNYVDPNLPIEKDSLKLGDLSAVTSNLTLPTKGTIDTAITIVWKSSNDSLISSTGVVHRPKYFNYPVTLTATLIKGGQSVSKTFDATVVAQSGTTFTSDLLVKFDFNKVQDSIVTDEAQQGFKGILKNQAMIQTIGDSTTGTYHVLDLGDSIGYFDMGTDMGAIMYNVTNYTVGAYFRISNNYPDSLLTSNGNFLWTFSNAPNILDSYTGYMFGSLKNEGIAITPNNWSGEEGVSGGSAAPKGAWHYMAYVQNDTIGTLYIDGFAVSSGTVKQTPASTLVQSGRFGTWYNWLGRSCYSGDQYLRQTLVYDFRIYDKALTDADFVGGAMDVPSMLDSLNNAYNAHNETAVPLVNSGSYYKILTSNHTIQIVGLNGTENVNLFDITGRKIASSVGQNTFTVNAGIYFVKVNDAVTKVMVR